VLNRLERAWHRILTAFAYLGALGLLALSLMITADVAMRWFSGRPFVGVFEISEVLLVLITFSAVGLVHMENRQLSVDILSSRARGRTAAGLRLFDAIIGILVFGLLVWKSWEEFGKAYAGGFLRRGMIEIPTTIPVGFILAGSACIVVTLVFIGWRSLARLSGKSGGDGPAPPA